MPARSKTQQRLMGQAYAYKTGEIKAKDLNPEYADEIKKLAKSMTEKQLEDFAKTKHKNLPEKVEEKIKRFDTFNESDEFEESKEPKVRVKDLVEYLQSLDPEMEVSLDKDGWDYHETGLETVKNSYLFDVWDYKGKKHLTINN
jgi:phage-related tail protein